MSKHDIGTSACCNPVVCKRGARMQGMRRLIRRIRPVLSVVLLLALGLSGHAQNVVIGPDRGPEPGPERPRSGKRLSLGGLPFDFAIPSGVLALRDSELPDALSDQLLFTTDADPGAIAAAAGLELLESVPLQSLGTQFAVVRLRRGDDLTAAQGRLAAQPGAQGVQRNQLSQTLGDTARAPLPKRFRVHRLADPGTQRVNGTIAMIDTAVALDHPALKGARIEQQSFIADASPAAHGTALAGLIVGTSEEVPGVAPGVRLINLAAFTPRKNGTSVATTVSLAKALDAAAMLKPDALNLSFGGKHDPLLMRLLDEIHRRGVCVAAAAGNGGPRATTVPFPASHHASLAVAAVDDKLKPYAYATRSMRIDVAAVGVDVFVPVPGAKNDVLKSGRYRRMSGSSMATAFVAGNLLRMPECSGRRDPQAMRQKVKAAALDMGLAGSDNVFGAGLFLLPEDNIPAR